jgi:hypothetical protein
MMRDTYYVSDFAVFHAEPQSSSFFSLKEISRYSIGDILENRNSVWGRIC